MLHFDNHLQVVAKGNVVFISWIRLIRGEDYLDHIASYHTGLYM
jgi:hypothetical protein